MERDVAPQAVPVDHVQEVLDAYRNGADVREIRAQLHDRHGLLLDRVAIVRCVAEYACDQIVRRAKVVADREVDRDPELMLQASEVMADALWLRLDVERL